MKRDKKLKRILRFIEEHADWSDHEIYSLVCREYAREEDVLAAIERIQRERKEEAK